MILIVSFSDKGTEDIFDGEDSKLARKTLPIRLHGKGAKTLDRLIPPFRCDPSLFRACGSRS